ncbi:16S rRNA (uracil(1498)-N(3))-methyltransferase [Mycoplasmopsis cynos]|nr:16S rRNA (uracil(1498)-N(3))-methyltransferase [Mycoplasmopsis cynos]MCU9935806.1 16S rRNA (uracil(1498)-N(3))-methyltransferase [Mycoplasmopsis cynos]UWV83097.1 16S rRNA (uracil(1498)-N(3))-methyltransferase [Mycoplasmopsis cynos]
MKFLRIELGAKPVSLGKRILRAETAAIYMMSKIKN